MPDNQLDFYKAVKVPIKHIIKHPDINLPKINNLVLMSHKIIIHTLQFIKLYSLDYYDKNNKLPVIDKTFINCCMKIICSEKATGRPPKKEVKDLKDKLILFYDKYYKPIQLDKLEYTYMNTILDYLTMDVMTCYENNIKEHFVEYVERYVNVIWQKKFMIDKIRKVKKTKRDRDNAVNRFNSDLRKIKNDLLNVEDNKFKSKSFYHQWIKEQKKLILPNKKFNKNLYYDLQCSPMDYLDKMVYMMKIVESYNMTTNNMFPLRTDVIPKHIRIDTTTLVHAMLTKNFGNKSDYLTHGNLKKNEDKIWKFFFRTERQCFNKPNYSFHHMIETDGVSVSILFKRTDIVGKRVFQKTTTTKEKYINELDNYKDIQNKKIVAIDPGKCDLIYCVDGDTNKANTFRYGQDQRRNETKIKKYSKIILNDKKKTKIKNKSIIDYETNLSKYNKKSLEFKKFIEYVKHKNEMNNNIMKFYEKSLFRKLKLNGYLNRKKTEQKMINRFTKTFGNKNDVIVCFGDYEQKKHMKFKEPIKGRGMRTLFKKNGFPTYLVDEFRTSCKCAKCDGGECNKFIIRKSPKPFQNNLNLVHGLLKCKTCSGVWNRDCNGATNIYKICYNAIRGKDRPTYLRRSNSSGVFDDTSKPQFTQVCKG